MTNSPATQGTVQYFDATYGGWRTLKEGGGVRDTWALSTARRKAKAISAGPGVLLSKTRVLVGFQNVAEYRNGIKIR